MGSSGNLQWVGPAQRPYSDDPRPRRQKSPEAERECLALTVAPIFKGDRLSFLSWQNETIQARLDYIQAGLSGSCSQARSLATRTKLREVTMGEGDETEKNVHAPREKGS